MGIFILLLLVTFILLIVYMTKTSTLTSKVEELEGAVRKLSGAINALRPEVPTRPVTGVSAAQPEAVQPGVTPAQVPPAGSPLPATAVASTPKPIAPAIQTPVATVSPPRPSRSRAEWEAFIGGKLLNRIGALALIIGVGFFLKYAFDKNWITETMRVAIGAVVGVGLLLGGARSHKKGYEIFSQGLVGAGISILYLSVYASFNFYHLVSQTAAFVLMSAVTVVAFFQALKYNSLAVGLLGWAGGFLTPFLLSTGESNEVGLFTYIALLDAGLLAVLIKKDTWVVLEPLAVGATYLTYLLWNQEFYSADSLLLTVFFLTVFWVLFYAVDVIRILRSLTTYAEARRVVGAFNAIFYYAAIYTIIDPEYHDWMAPVTLAVGAVYFLTVLAMSGKRPENTMAIAQYTLTAIVLLVLATTIQFTGFTTVMFWSVEALILAWFGLRWKLGYVWKAALGLYILAALKLVFTGDALSFSAVESFRVVLNDRALAFSILAAALGGGAVLFHRSDILGRSTIRAWLHFGWCFVLFTLVTVETNDYFRRLLLNTRDETEVGLLYMRLLTLVVVWVVYSFPLVWTGLRKNVLPVVYSGLGGIALAAPLSAIRGITFVPIEQFTVLFNFRALVLAFVVVAIFVHARWLKSRSETYSWISDLLGVLNVAAVFLILCLLTGETRDFFERAIALLKQGVESSAGSDELNRLRDLQQLSLSGVWLFYSILLMVIGIWRRRQSLRMIAIGLFGITILKIFIYDLSFLDTLYRIFSFVGLGLILLAVSYLYQRYKAVIFESPAAK